MIYRVTFITTYVGTAEAVTVLCSALANTVHTGLFVATMLVLMMAQLAVDALVWRTKEPANDSKEHAKPGLNSF